MEKQFRDSIGTALDDAKLSAALGKFSEDYKVNRAKIYEDTDFEALRSQIAERKAFAAAHMEELAAQFTKNAEAKGAKVFRATSPEAVREYILKVAKDNQVKTIVKSKSMATEEVHLNPYLEKAGIEVAETDLGVCRTCVPGPHVHRAG